MVGPPAKLDAFRALQSPTLLEGDGVLHARQANVTTAARYLNVRDDYRQELIERKPLALVKA